MVRFLKIKLWWGAFLNVCFYLLQNILDFAVSYFDLLVGASSWAHTSLLSWHELRFWGDCGTFWSDLNVLRCFNQLSMFLFWGDLYVLVSCYHFHFSSVEKIKCICIYLALSLFLFWGDLHVLVSFYHFHFSSVEKIKCICIYLALSLCVGVFVTFTLLILRWPDCIGIFLATFTSLWEWPEHFSVLCHFHFSCFEVTFTYWCLFITFTFSVEKIKCICIYLAFFTFLILR